MSEDLKPCPFCGGVVEIVEAQDGEGAYVQCLDVKMHRALWMDGDNNAAGEVAEQWNRRADLRPDPRVRVLREALTQVREIIKEGAMEGFNPMAGTWAERLFASQAMTRAALATGEQDA